MSTEAAKDKLVADPKRSKMVKIKARMAIRLGDETFKEGAVVECTEEQADEFCKEFKGPYAFKGERHISESQRHIIKRAERVA